MAEDVWSGFLRLSLIFCQIKLRPTARLAEDRCGEPYEGSLLLSTLYPDEDRYPEDKRSSNMAHAPYLMESVRRGLRTA
jgi:hypothetical protein